MLELCLLLNSKLCIYDMKQFMDLVNSDIFVMQKQLKAGLLLMKSENRVNSKQQEVLEKFPVPTGDIRKIYVTSIMIQVIVFQNAIQGNFTVQHQVFSFFSFFHAFFIVCVCGCDVLQSYVFGKCWCKHSLFTMTLNMRDTL